MRALLILVCMAGFPAEAFAQAAITGSVRDPSGAAMAGVSVEATSPALIEKRLLNIDGLIKRALAQHPEDWPKGCSWN